MPIQEFFAFNTVSADAEKLTDAAVIPAAQASTAILLLNVKRTKVIPPIRHAQSRRHPGTQFSRPTLRGKNAATKIKNNSKIFDALSVVKENDLKIESMKYGLERVRLTWPYRPSLPMRQATVRTSYALRHLQDASIKIHSK
ncbi:hypothetical protein [Paraburkholderia sp.]|uniref:hypothetical protein n=1 Tax=Paraburkholderia sp. TaxID=1926495 RepID=UPI002AFDD58F|nr:hypothetical protein [Paraburkholderia sp.]